MSILDFLKKDKKEKSGDEKEKAEHFVKSEKAQKKNTAPIQSEQKEKKLDSGSIDAGASKILIHPHITEKSSGMRPENKYVVEIDPKANKIEVKNSIKKIFGVMPIKVNVISIAGKIKRYGKVSGVTKDRKKVIITLKEGDKIDVGEGS